MKANRKQTSQYVPTTINLPIAIRRSLEIQAEADFSGNQSALVTAALAEYLGVELPSYLTEVKSASAL